MLVKLDIDEKSDESVAIQLRNALTANAVRIIDLFREWDDSGDGEVSKAEFRKAMIMLGFEVPRKDIDSLFDLWDPDRSGRLTVQELNKQLINRLNA